MCDHYAHYFPEDKEQRDLQVKKQMEMLKPIRFSFQQIQEEISFLKKKIHKLEQTLPNY